MPKELSLSFTTRVLKHTRIHPRLTVGNPQVRLMNSFNSTYQMVGRPLMDLDTPALTIDVNRMEENIRKVASMAEKAGIELRPHIKTHKMPIVAHKQISGGAVGITAAKLSEAEVMVDNGILDIFIAHVIVGEPKLSRLVKLSRRCRLCVGVDLPDHVKILSETFVNENKPLDVMIEIDTGQRRQGRPSVQAAVEVAKVVQNTSGVQLRGIFTHEGHDYAASSIETLETKSQKAQELMIETEKAIRKVTDKPCRVSVGSTPSLYCAMLNQENSGYIQGIDEIRSGTFIFCDASMSGILGHTNWCAAFVLATVVNRPTPDRLIIDAGAKALSIDRRPEGTMMHTEGLGIVEGNPDFILMSISDEHGVIRIPESAGTHIGDKLRIIPTHICPTVNLYDVAFAIQKGQVEAVWPINARGKTQ